MRGWRRLQGAARPRLSTASSLPSLEPPLLVRNPQVHLAALLIDAGSEGCSLLPKQALDLGATLEDRAASSG